jgi:hypothetical protein
MTLRSKMREAMKEHTPPVLALDKCCMCGWEFDVENKRKVFYDSARPEKYRREARTQVRLPSGESFAVFCHDCYEKYLWERRAHSKQVTDDAGPTLLGTTAASVYREGLYAQPAVQLTIEQMAARTAQLNALMAPLVSNMDGIVAAAKGEPIKRAIVPRTVDGILSETFAAELAELHTEPTS